MQSKQIDRRVNFNIYCVTIATAVLGVVFYTGIHLESWAGIVILTLLQLYLGDVKVDISERTDISLSSAAVLPMVYLCGGTTAMIVSVFLGLHNGIKYKKDWERTIFNSAQFALSALMMTLSFEYVRDVLGGSGFGLVVAAVTGTLVYIVFNIGLVAKVFSIWRGIPWWKGAKELFEVAIYSSLSSGFIGILFTFFVMQFGFWGLVTFSVLLINLSGLLEAASAVNVARDQRKKVQEELVIDEMTGAYNFRFLNNWLSDPSKEEISLIFMDVDDFAGFNNTYGHAEGDRVLGRLVETISKSIRADDRIIRYGGDEFVVFLQGMDAEGAQRVAERIVKNLRSLENPKWEQPLTVSLGIANMPEHTVDKRQLLLFADQAMYRAKDSGKNNIRIWNIAKDSNLGGC